MTDTEVDYSHYQELKIAFNLYTRKNLEVPQKLEVSKCMENAILQSNFDRNKSNKILIHGFQDSGLDPSILKIKDNFLTKEDCNVWIIDWSVVAAGPPMYYESVVKRMGDAAKCMSTFVGEISKLTQAGENAFHIIGHSLGAHMAGNIGNALGKTSIARITGLDPAFPLFRCGKKKYKLLCKDDAKFVDVLHTNGQNFGQTDPVGTVDFYLNGGFNQPQCSQIGNICCHMSSLEYFAESIITTVGFYGYSCSGIDNYIAGNCPPKEPDTLMGEYVDKSITGTYIVWTNGDSPFARGKIR